MKKSVRINMKNTENDINPLFRIENVNKIIIPPVVKDDLCNFLREKLDKAGFYYRITYRVKSNDSILNKLLAKDYGREGSIYHDKKLQDLVGIRIILYFGDDIHAVKQLLDTLFTTEGEWETTEASVYEFRARKVNGIFKIPEYLSKLIINPSLEDYIDDTFEIQLRTNAFEGWHEIEHDMHYKSSVFHEENSDLFRLMNSVLATLELCDDSIIRLLEDLGHYHYKMQNWDEMIKCHYRLKFINEPLIPELDKFFNENVDIAKQIFKFDRFKVLEEFWNTTSDTDVVHTSTNVVRIVNNLEIKSDEITEIFNKLDKEKKQKTPKKHFEPFKELAEYAAFASKVELNIVNDSVEETFKKAAGYIYSWIKSRFKNVFSNMPEMPKSYKAWKPGYRVDVHYDEEKCEIMEISTHPDNVVPEREWISRAYIKRVGDKLEFAVTNHLAEQNNFNYEKLSHGLFSRPNFYGEIADNIGIIDVARLKQSTKLADNDGMDDLYELVDTSNRVLPVIVFLAVDNDWVNNFDVDYFSYLVGYYAHVILIKDNDAAVAFATKYNLDIDKCKNSVVAFYQNKEPQVAHEKDILDAKYEVIKMDTKRYWNETGVRAYRRKLIANIRENILDMYENGWGKGRIFKSSLIGVELPQSESSPVMQVPEEEMWDSCDKFGNVIRHGAIARADADDIPKGVFHRVVSVYTVTRTGKILITRRSPEKRHPGLWEITCGSVLAGEEVREGAVRELYEETGLKCTTSNLNALYVHTDNKRRAVYFSFIHIIPNESVRIKLQPNETDDYRFISFEEFDKLAETAEFSVSESERYQLYRDMIKNNFEKI